MQHRFMVGPPASRIGSIAKTLMVHPAKPLYQLTEEETDPAGFTIWHALEPNGLSEVLFDILAPSRLVRSELYGYANEDIDVSFSRLRDSLVRLAVTGSIDPDIIDDGKITLGNLIRGVTVSEACFRSEVNPTQASHTARLTRLLRGVTDDGPITPNEIDEEQVRALDLYQRCRNSRFALESILDATLQIERALMDGPDRPRSGWSR